jgi:ATP-dependent RNA helicase DDX23/PRP28
LQAAVDAMGWTEPSPIQRAAIPVGLGRRDIIGIAETGSGKTGAFSIPMINYCLTVPKEYRTRTPEEGPLALVMAPTRELAEQIETQVATLIQGTGLKSCSGVGGKPIEDQAFALRQGVDILIGTPGRLKDLIDSRYLVLNQCNYIVLDEADRMVDMGFEDQVIAVLDMMGGLLKSNEEEEAEAQAEAAQRGEQLYRVTAMFSATMPPAVERIARSYLRAPATIKIGDQNSGKNKRIDQRVIMTTEPGKKNTILDLLTKNRKDEDKFIVFVNAKRACDVLARNLEQAHLTCGILHGGKSQDQREASLEAFRKGEFTVLVATDVAARGLDIPDVSHVINYDMPAKIENYCHRIGRTGRAGKEGVATTLLTENDNEVFYDLKAYLESTDMKVPNELAKHPAAQQAPGTRNEDGKLMGKRRDAVMYSNK